MKIMSEPASMDAGPPAASPTGRRLGEIILDVQDI